jgi:hypothetical protein
VLLPAGRRARAAVPVSRMRRAHASMLPHAARACCHVPAPLPSTTTPQSHQCHAFVPFTNTKPRRRRRRKHHTTGAPSPSDDQKHNPPKATKAHTAPQLPAETIPHLRCCVCVCVESNPEPSHILDDEELSSVHDVGGRNHVRHGTRVPTRDLGFRSDTTHPNANEVQHDEREHHLQD